MLRVLCGYVEQQGRVQFEGCAAEPLPTKWSCLLLHIVLQDGLNEVVKVYPPLKLRVFVDDLTAFTEG